MDIKKCTDKVIWEASLRGNEHFLQSFVWGEFQQAAGREVLRLQVVDGEEVVGQAQGVVTALGFGVSYVYLSGISNFEFQILETILKFFNEQSYTFVRMESAEKIDISNFQFPISITKNRQPQHTLVLDISKTEEELLAGMHRKTRYNIRLAEKKGVEVRKEKDIDVFWKLNEQTTSRDKFKSHDKIYYAKMLEMDTCHQLTAYYEGVPVASNICIASGETFTYLHGASGSEHRNVMAPYLLQWEGMKFAKEFGCTQYDFWGIAPPREKSESGSVSCSHNLCWDNTDTLAGVTRFKAGFGGMPVSYPQAVDIIFSQVRYRLYSLAKKVI